MENYLKMHFLGAHVREIDRPEKNTKAKSATKARNGMKAKNGRKVGNDMGIGSIKSVIEDTDKYRNRARFGLFL